MFGLSHPWILLLALAVDAWLGDPGWLYRRMPHPAQMLGSLIAWADGKLNRSSDTDGRRRMLGLVFAAALTGTAFLLGWAIQGFLLALPFGPVWLGLVMSVLIAQQSLYTHVADVAKALSLSGLAGGRIAVARIVGRDPEVLDEAGVSRAAIESLAENFSDGVVAPVFWGLLFGLPGMLAYKAINTADSMIGHRTPRHLAFGWASARLDDFVNLPASRLSGLVFILAAFLLPGGDPKQGWIAMLRDARRHKSPNAGWPEAALAGALGFALAGPRRYHGQMTEDGWMNEGGRTHLGSADISRALQLYLRGALILAASVLAVAMLAH